MEKIEIFYTIFFLYRQRFVDFWSLILTADYLFFPERVTAAPNWKKQLIVNPEVCNQIVKLVGDIREGKYE